MYTVEYDWDEICITILDDTGEHDDVIVNSFDDIVYIRQWDEELNCVQSIAMSPAQWEELIAAIGSTEGGYVTIKGVRK